MEEIGKSKEEKNKDLKDTKKKFLIYKITSDYILTLRKGDYRS